jgi:hypothetical protein
LGRLRGRDPYRRADLAQQHLTDDERTLRDLAFPLIEPPTIEYVGIPLLYEYGQKREFRRNLLVIDPTAYYRHLLVADYRSTAGRFNLRNDVVCIGPFFELAHRVIEADHKRQATLDLLTDISPVDRSTR